MKPLTRPRRKLRYSVYDLEWAPHTCELRLIGVYDELGYRSYRTVAEFLSNECHSGTRDRWYYAHAGGLFDLRFLIDTLLYTPGVTARGAFSGSSCVFFTVQRGRHKWHFLDSYWLIRQPLREIGQWLGLAKGGQSEKSECYYGLRPGEPCRCDPVFTGPIAELAAYNERDCELLWKAIGAVEDGIWEFGGDIRGTIASTALALFRRRYLDREISIPKSVNTWVRRAYYASRVEVFQQSTGPGRYYDINSAFPAGMLAPLPAEYRGVSRSLPRKGEYVADVTITSPESDIPALPWRDEDKRVFFPHGQWRARYTREDIECLLSRGGSIDKIHQVVCFDTFDGLSRFATELYEGKRKASSEAERYVYKILLNGCYGKFAERGEKVELRLHPPDTACPHGGIHAPNGLPGSCWQYLTAGVWLLRNERKVPHAHVAIGATITARARSMLLGHMRAAPEVYYCDTDGFAVGPDVVFPLGTGLGELKLEKEFRSAYFASSKLYRLELATGTMVRGRGYPRLSDAGFARLLDGEPWQYEQFERLKSGLRKAHIAPSQDWTERVFRTGSDAPRPKRRLLPDGSTEPWHISELI